MKKSKIIITIIFCVMISIQSNVAKAYQVSTGWYNAFVGNSNNVDTRSKDGIIKSYPITFTSANGWGSQNLLSNTSMGSRIDSVMQLNLEEIPKYIDSFDGRADFYVSITYSIGYRMIFYVNFAGTYREIGFTIILLYLIDLGPFGAGLGTLYGVRLERQEFTTGGGSLTLYENYQIQDLSQLELDIFASLINIDNIKYFDYNLVLYLNKSYTYDQLNTAYLYSAGNCYITGLKLNLVHGFNIMANVQIKPSLINIPCVYIRALHSTSSSYPTRVSNYFSTLFSTEFIVENTQTLPENAIVWNYNSYAIRKKQDLNITFNREYSEYNETLNETETKNYEYSFVFSELEVYSIENPYYINTKFINPNDWGNWEIRMFQGTAIEAVLNFNWLRNGLVFVVNAIVILFQSMFYLIILAVQFLLVQLILWVIIIIWNYPIYWIVIGVIGIVFHISFFFVWLWNQAVILWKIIIGPAIQWLINWIVSNVWNPLVEFFRNGGLKILFDFYMIILSYVIATLLWIFTFGTTDFSTIQQSIQTMLLSINFTIFEFVGVFLANFVLILAASATYILLIGLIYIKYVYAKSRGYVQRAARLQSMINVYKIPLVLTVRLISYVIGFLQGGVPTDGLEDK